MREDEDELVAKFVIALCICITGYVGWHLWMWAT